MRIGLLGHRQGRPVLGPALEQAGHGLVELEREAEAAVDFTRPTRSWRTSAAALEDGRPVVVGTTGFDPERGRGARRARRVWPVFSHRTSPIGAVLMMRFAARRQRRSSAGGDRRAPRTRRSVDAPSGTAKATAELIGGDAPIHSVRLPGLVAHQEVIFGGPGQTLTIRHDTTSREAFVPGVLLALERLRGLPPGLTVGLEPAAVGGGGLLKRGPAQCSTVSLRPRAVGRRRLGTVACGVGRAA